MHRFKDWFEENYKEEFPKGDVINKEWFDKRSLPMIVHCTCCEMTMALPSAIIDENGYIYCSTCGGVD